MSDTSAGTPPVVDPEPDDSVVDELSEVDPTDEDAKPGSESESEPEVGGDGEADTLASAEGKTDGDTEDKEPVENAATAEVGSDPEAAAATTDALDDTDDPSELDEGEGKQPDPDPELGGSDVTTEPTTTADGAAGDTPGDGDEGGEPKPEAEATAGEAGNNQLATEPEASDPGVVSADAETGEQPEAEAVEPAPVTRAEFDALVKRVSTLEALGNSM